MRTYAAVPRGLQENASKASRKSQQMNSSEFARGTWLNPPETWDLKGGRLRAVTDSATDFWRETHYGFTRDSGHFFGCSVAADFTAEVRVRANYDALYDQAGFMIRIDERNWVKAGIEKSDGQCLLSSVLTVGRSDWAIGVYDGDASDFWMRATVKSGVIRLQVSADGRRWPLVRLAPFPKAPSYLVGPMCCTPERAGLAVEFSDLRIMPPLDRALHDLA
jgi:hypothetical protein